MDMNRGWWGPACRVLSVGVGLLFFLSSCETTQRRPLPERQAKIEKNVLKVGVSPNTPPIIFKQGLEISGLEADLARELGVYLGKEVRFIEVPWEELIDQLRDRRIDIIMSGMSITQGRLFQFSFSDPYYHTGLLALFRTEDQRRFSEGWEQSLLEEYYLNLGAQKGTVGEIWIRDNLPDMRLVTYQNPANSVSDLQYGYLDIFIDDALVIHMLAAENEAKGLIASKNFLEEYAYAWGVRRDDAQLLTSANAFLATIRKNGRLEAVLRRWIPE
jgi:ABC-type amino acid transport substrate-binding protein